MPENLLQNISTTKINPDKPLTISLPTEKPEAIPYTSSTINSYVPEQEGGTERIPGLTVTFTVVPKKTEIETSGINGAKIFEAIINIINELGGDLTSLSIRKDPQKNNK